MVANIKDMTGERFGLLTVIGMHPHRNRFKQVMWDCRCDCGNMIAYSGCLLRINNIVHCGKCPLSHPGLRQGVDPPSMAGGSPGPTQGLHRPQVDRVDHQLLQGRWGSTQRRPRSGAHQS